MKLSRQKLSLFFALLLSISMVLGLVPAVQAEEASSDPVSILACSDFQSPRGNLEGRSTVSAILDAMKQDGITKADGFICCGDYDYEYTDTKGGITALRAAVKKFVPSNHLYVQGNHDTAIGTNGLCNSGNNDPAHGKYGVFAINEDDYMWYNSYENTVKHTTQNLIDYLNEKLEAGYDKPIFVVSHLGLHYSMRTHNEGDGKYAHYLFDALNEAARKGLNIIYLYGHDHSNGWDDYLGGAAVYLAKGDSILVGQGTNASKKKKTLAFTYLNAGYVGYYSNVNGQDDTMTMTYITVSDQDVTITRYDKNGKHNLKSAGVANAYHNESGYQPNPDVYPSPQTIPLTSVSDQTPIENLLNVDKTKPLYRRVDSAGDLKDGGKYLMILRSSSSIMLSKEVTKNGSTGSRIGFDVESTELFGGSLAYADCIGKEWVFEKSGRGWLIGDGERYVSYEDLTASGKGIAAKLTDTGRPLTIEGECGFTFFSGSYSFNYNSRGLVNFYTSDPSSFYLYELLGYGVTVEGGYAVSEDEPTSYAKPGDTLTLTASDAPSGYVFDRWVVTSGNAVLSDPTQMTLTLTMPDEAISLEATYKAAVANPNNASGSLMLWIALSAGGVVLVAIAGTVVIIRRKKKVN
jgi:hypothetical protein